MVSDKRQLLLDESLRLFYEKGIHAVGINEILKETGVAKKTLYRYFPSKDDLVLETLKYRDQRFLIWLEQALRGSVSNEELVSRLFRALTEWFDDRVPELSHFRGCFFINTSAEFPDTGGEISRYCKAHKESVRQLIGRLLPVPDENLLDMLCILKEGAIVSAFVNQDKTAAERCLPIIIRWMRS
ncbi:TetR/AcrR family transcriptional regulator [Vibrio mangrovi]|uniref:Putative HTH-type transcriptional regulator YxaF n=1 Tax=Vibrio mangrovi TaxID=474394 RepID=A0A1Y6IMR7_9VIBR|nr:TetR/AcrR family transcriptional regulator [Vibrio mangrovi]MDW6004263.1 TetR/AcrR family transcriptional regulator [Vibrio mangrovi]SMR98938.1 putative HTH-type transcriptional regulator YxaF [Vibrio mangrovi]